MLRQDIFMNRLITTRIYHLRNTQVAGAVIFFTLSGSEKQRLLAVASFNKLIIVLDDTTKAIYLRTNDQND